jgi:hypothetical protein
MFMDMSNILEPGSSKRIKTENSEFPKCDGSDDLKENNTEICKVRYSSSMFERTVFRK